MTFLTSKFRSHGSTSNKFIGILPGIYLPSSIKPQLCAQGLWQTDTASSHHGWEGGSWENKINNEVHPQLSSQCTCNRNWKYKSIIIIPVWCVNLCTGKLPFLHQQILACRQGLSHRSLVSLSPANSNSQSSSLKQSTNSHHNGVHFVNSYNKLLQKCSVLPWRWN